MKKIVEPRLLKGFRDFLPEKEMERKRIQSILEKIFGQFGFVPIDTPVLEYTEVLLGKGGGETDKQIYRFADHGKRDVAMRFDLTVPFARFIAGNRSKLYFPFKRYHISKVWRGENTQRGRYREFTQCDFDIVGSDSPSSDFEILHLIYESFKGLNITNFNIRLSSREIFNRFLGHLGLGDKSVEILRSVDKITKIGRDKVFEILSSLSSGLKGEKILDFIMPEKDSNSTLLKISELAGGRGEDTERVEEILEIVKELQIDNYFTLDPSITRGLDYYTGIVYETFLTDLPSMGSVCSGGRYNNLASTYTREVIPGVGSSIGLDRLMAALEELNTAEEKKQETRVLIVLMDKNLVPYYHKLSSVLRKEGLPSEVYPEDKKIGTQFKFAEAKGIPIALICGGDEKGSGTVTIKNLLSRENHNDIPLNKMVDFIRGLLK